MQLQLSEINTLGQLKKSGWKSKSVKEEIRSNVIQALRNGETLFPDIVGYDETVIPQIVNAILAKHDFILLGLRGQAKTKILRSLYRFLDDYIPYVEGSEIYDDPFQPLSKYAKQKIQELGDDTPISWLAKEQRYGEKLATPDTSVADLIGDIDPIKAAANKWSLSDELAINYGLIPRSNRGIFAINELPDLQARIQVALLNILQERDIQIRSFNLRIPLDIMMVFSANPEDYTNRGSIITPLKDRIDAQIITHYPKHRDIGLEITKSQAWESRDNDIEVAVPHAFREIVEEVAIQARKSDYVDQKSGVSARLTIAAMEMIISAAERRAAINGESKTELRLTDLYHMIPALTGKLELVYEGEQEGPTKVALHLIGESIKKVFSTYFPLPEIKTKNKRERNKAYDGILNWFSEANTLQLADNDSDATYREKLQSVPGLHDFIKNNMEQPTGEGFAFMDLTLDVLHQYSILGRNISDSKIDFTDMMGSLLNGLSEEEDLDDYDDLY